MSFRVDILRVRQQANDAMLKSNDNEDIKDDFLVDPNFTLSDIRTQQKQQNDLDKLFTKFYNLLKSRRVLPSRDLFENAEQYDQMIL